MLDHPLIRALAVIPLAVGATLGFSYYAQHQIDALKEERFEEELLYLPNERLLHHFTAGLSSIVANLLWLRTIEYTVTEFHNQDRKFTWLNSMVNTVTRLDPYFAGAYRYGGMLLAAIGADDQALALLRRGMVNNPYNEYLPFEAAQIYLLNRKNEPGTPAMATFYLRMVAERSDTPEFYLSWIRRIQQRENMDTIGRDLWQDVLEKSDDAFIREVAKEKIREFTIQDNTKALTEAVSAFQQEMGRLPTNIGELVEQGFVENLPTDPEQGRYFIGKDGTVYNELLVAVQTEERRNAIQRSLEAYRKRHGAYPESLEAWVEEAGVRIPPHPAPGRTWQYDPDAGEVR